LLRIASVGAFGHASAGTAAELPNRADWPVNVAERAFQNRVVVVAARDELVVHDLVAYQSPLTQVLSLPKLRTERGGPAALRELLRMEIDADCGQAAGRES
jgi:hypothetical protein